MTFTPSTRSTAAKLGLVPGASLLRLGAPLPAFDDDSAVAVEHDADVVLLGGARRDDVAEHLPRAWEERRAGGRLWLAYRKGSASFTRADLGAAVDAVQLGLTWYRQVALPERWSAIWFRHRSEFRTLNH